MFKPKDIHKFTQGNGNYSTFRIQKSANKTKFKVNKHEHELSSLVAVRLIDKRKNKDTF